MCDMQHFHITIYVRNNFVIEASLSEPQSDGKSRTVVRARKNDGEIQDASHYCKFGTVVHAQKYTDKLR